MDDEVKPIFFIRSGGVGVEICEIGGWRVMLQTSHPYLVVQPFVYRSQCLILSREDMLLTDSVFLPYVNSVEFGLRLLCGLRVEFSTGGAQLGGEGCIVQFKQQPRLMTGSPSSK